MTNHKKENIKNTFLKYVLKGKGMFELVGRDLCYHFLVWEVEN